MKKISMPFVLMAALFTLQFTDLSAQKKFIIDTNYYEKFRNKIAVRLYLAQKYVHLNFPESGKSDVLEYKANPKLNLGIGFTSKNFSLNIFNGFSFLNTKDEPKGKTKGLDMQLHFYPRKWSIDLLAELPEGFHIEPKGQAGAPANSYYYREDMKWTLFGLSVYRVPNSEKFSYKAALQQSDWQKKSAGSFLIGGAIYSGKLEGDSALIPRLLQGSYPQSGVTKINFLSIGPGVGYAHTFVINQHFFFTGSVVGNLSVNFINEHTTEKLSKVSVNPTEVFKAAAGYNSNSMNISVNWTGNGNWVNSSLSPKNYFFPSGNIRFVVAKKFSTHKHHHS